MRIEGLNEEEVTALIISLPRSGLPTTLKEPGLTKLVQQLD